MQQIRKHIANALAVLLLILVQGLSIQAEHDDMYLQDTAAQGANCTVISKHSFAKNLHQVPVEKQKHSKQRKMHHGKNTNLKLSVPETDIVTTTYIGWSDAAPCVFTEDYHYLFYRDINPPPPRA